MVSLTENEARTIEFLVRNFSRDCNINQLAKELQISPGGMFKILKKLERDGFLGKKKSGNNVFYRINFRSRDAADACAFAMTGKKASPYVRAVMKDLEKLRPHTELAILFGSVLRKGREARDIDVLLVFRRTKLKDVETAIGDINRIRLKRIHAVYQTPDDFSKNIRKKDNVVLEAIRTGIVMWGRDFLIKAVGRQE